MDHFSRVKFFKLLQSNYVYRRYVCIYTFVYLYSYTYLFSLNILVFFEIFNRDFSETSYFDHLSGLLANFLLLIFFFLPNGLAIFMSFSSRFYSVSLCFNSKSNCQSLKSSFPPQLQCSQITVVGLILKKLFQFGKDTTLHLLLRKVIAKVCRLKC